MTLRDMFPPSTTRIGPRTKVVFDMGKDNYSVLFRGRLVAEFQVVRPRPEQGGVHTATAFLSPELDLDIEKNTEWQNVKQDFANSGTAFRPTGSAAMYVFAKRFAVSLEENDGDGTLFLKPDMAGVEKSD